MRSNRTLLYGLLVAGTALVVLVLTGYLRLADEITVYQATCAPAYVNGRCSGQERATDPITFKPMLATQTLVYWWSDRQVARPDLMAIET